MCLTWMDFLDQGTGSLCPKLFYRQCKKCWDEGRVLARPPTQCRSSFVRWCYLCIGCLSSKPGHLWICTCLLFLWKAQDIQSLPWARCGLKSPDCTSLIASVWATKLVDCFQNHVDMYQGCRTCSICKNIHSRSSITFQQSENQANSAVRKGKL